MELPSTVAQNAFQTYIVSKHSPTANVASQVQGKKARTGISGSGLFAICLSSVVSPKSTLLREGAALPGDTPVDGGWTIFVG